MDPGIVIAFPNIEDARKIRSILIKNGYEVLGVANTVPGILTKLSDLECGIVICGYKLKDQYYLDVLEYLPQGFELILVASPAIVQEAPYRVSTVELPLRLACLKKVLDELREGIIKKYKKKNKKPVKRSEQDMNTINKAKQVLMEKNHLTEEEAYRYIQKCSMDAGTNMVETAEMILMLEGIM